MTFATVFFFIKKLNNKNYYLKIKKGSINDNFLYQGSNFNFFFLNKAQDRVTANVRINDGSTDV